MFYEKIKLLLIIANHVVEFICVTFSKNITKRNLKNNNSNCNWILVVRNIYDHKML
jgi:hypothetical protein